MIILKMLMSLFIRFVPGYRFTIVAIYYMFMASVSEFLAKLLHDVTKDILINTYNIKVTPREG